MSPITSQSALDQRARRAAARVNLTARRSRRQAGTIDNKGGFQLIDPYSNGILCGERFDMTADAVVEFCRRRR